MTGILGLLTVPAAVSTLGFGAEIVDHERRTAHPAHLAVLVAWGLVVVALVAGAWMANAGSAFWRFAVVWHHASLSLALAAASVAVGLQLARLLRPGSPRRFAFRGAVSTVLIAGGSAVGLRHLPLNAWVDFAPLVLAPVYLVWAFSGCWTAPGRLEAAQRSGRRLVLVSFCALFTAMFIRWLTFDTELTLGWWVSVGLALGVAPPKGRSPVDLAGLGALAPLAIWLGWAQLEPVERVLPRVGHADFLQPPPGPWPAVCEDLLWDLQFGGFGTGTPRCRGRSFAPLDHVLVLPPTVALDDIHTGPVRIPVDHGRHWVEVDVGTAAWQRARHPEGVFVHPISYTRFLTDDGEIGLSELVERADGRALVFDRVPGWTVQDWLTVCASTHASGCHLQAEWSQYGRLGWP